LTSHGLSVYEELLLKATLSAFWARETPLDYSEAYVLWLEYTRYSSLTKAELADAKAASIRSDIPAHTQHESLRRVRDEEVLTVLAEELNISIFALLHSLVTISGPGPSILVTVFSHVRLCHTPGFWPGDNSFKYSLGDERRKVMSMATQLWTNLSGTPVFNFSLTDFSKVYGEMVKDIGHGGMDDLLTQSIAGLEPAEQLRHKERIKRIGESCAIMSIPLPMSRKT
jgi:hypothetical protein